MVVSAPAPAQALRIAIHGIVQGVGFRPFVYRLAHRMAVQGTVANNGQGVVIEVSGPESALAAFIEALRTEAPPVARIEQVEIAPLDQPTVTSLESGFHILPSRAAHVATAPITPDLALCDDCRREIEDPANRRFRYPFTNCTNCGPRFSIVARIPYDRPNTSMHKFSMCAACSQEYRDPLDRRFHAQPNACPVCGPRLSWHDANGKRLEGDPLALAARALGAGQVVAIKGLGGFHLAVDATSEQAVGLLRQRKRRPAKPLALMVRDLATAQRFCTIDPVAAKMLCSPEHPIVLVPLSPRAPIAANIAPGLGEVGLMLAYTPLHVLLLAEPSAPKALVMTSGNPSGAPICTGNAEALRRLRGLADFFLLHDRDILTRVDDSLVRIIDGAPRLLRRARGYAPVPVPLRRPTGDILACGAEMKNTFCIVRDGFAYLSQHIGELSGVEQGDFYRESIDHLQAVLERVPAQVACDFHPDYQSTRYAKSRTAASRGIQHHHAHIGAVLAEVGLDGPVLGIVLDGTGYGGDGTVFGGEIYRADRGGFERLARLAHLPLPGGDRAAEQPWRMALALLWQNGGQQALTPTALPQALHAIEMSKRQVIGQMLATGLQCPRTSSCGRLFDAVAALLGLCLVNSYEGEAAMRLEHQASLAADESQCPAYPVQLDEQDGLLVLGHASLVRGLLGDLAAGVEVAQIARRFHDWLVLSLVTATRRLVAVSGLDTVVLAGGCLQNKRLFETLAHQLREDGCTVHAGVQVPMNDGGIALGQAYIGGNLCV